MLTTKCISPPAATTQIIAGEEQVPDDTTALTGALTWPEPAFAVPSSSVQRQLLWTLLEKASLFFGVTCHVRRRLWSSL